MDMQPEVQFTLYSLYKKPQKKLALISETDVVFSGIEVREFSRVTIKLISTDPKAKLLIETYESSHNFIEVRPSDQELEIMQGGNSEEMLVPGHYIFKIYSHGKKFKSYYSVISAHFSSESLLNLKKYLDNMLKGLAYDLIRRKHGMISYLPNINPTLGQIYYLLEKNSLYLVNYLEDIMKNPITNIVGEYKITPYTQKPDFKSFQWQAKKGTYLSISSKKGSLYKEKHALISANTVENHWLRYIIRVFLTVIKKIDASFQKEINHKENIKQLKEKEINKIKNKIDRIPNNNYGYAMSVTKLTNSVNNTMKQLKELDREIEPYLKRRQFIRRLGYKLTLYDTEPWIQPIPTYKPKKITQGIFKDYRYRKVYNLYRDISRIEQNKSTLHNTSSTFRRTWELFEYYSVGLVIDILIEYGYRWEQGWLADQNNFDYHIGTLPKGTIMKFKKPNSNYYIEVAYDAELEQSVGSDKSYSRYFNAQGRKPDIRLTIYNDDGTLYSNGDSFKDGLIIEVKCRRHHYIINEKVDPDIKEQLKAFKLLEYYEVNNKKPEESRAINTIKQVIVVYPKQEGKEPYILDHVYSDGIVYLQINPTNPADNVKPFGYKKLKENIGDFLP